MNLEGHSVVAANMKNHLGKLAAIRIMLPSLAFWGCNASLAQTPAVAPPAERRTDPYFRIQIVDDQTGRGVPLVQLRTVNNIRLWTDSNGIIAFNEPGLMNRVVFFFVEGPGYECPKDGFGFAGVRLVTDASAAAVVKMKRLNIAHRLYRVTGQGIYADSLLTGHPVPIAEPVLNGQVLGQDSVDVVLYNGRLFWTWGDTARPSYPLGHFAMSGALSDLPEKGGLDPALGVNLNYFVDKTGFSRPVAPMKEPGLIWLDGFLTVRDPTGKQRLAAKFARMKDLGTCLERGFVLYDDAAGLFEPVLRGSPDFLPTPNLGHAFAVSVSHAGSAGRVAATERSEVDGPARMYYYFAGPFPVAVRTRVKADWSSVFDPNEYEIFTSLPTRSTSFPRKRESRLEASSPQATPYPNSQSSVVNIQSPRVTATEQSEVDARCRWVSTRDLLRSGTSHSALVKQLDAEYEKTRLIDVVSGKEVLPHGGSIYWNPYLRRWLMIAVQQFSDVSMLGEVWTACGDTPTGPWVYAQKIATHPSYSFYNPKHHPYFDQDGGRIIYFEGTYTATFSTTPENATPRYDYNQLMYRLELDDPRLILPVPVYQLADSAGRIDYASRDELGTSDRWSLVQSAPFCAMPADRPRPGMIPIYRQTMTVDAAQVVVLGSAPAVASDKPLFLAFPADAPQQPCLAPLYEYRHAASAARCYATADPADAAWSRADKPLCLVWKPSGKPLNLDPFTQPATMP